MNLSFTFSIIQLIIMVERYEAMRRIYLCCANNVFFSFRIESNNGPNFQIKLNSFYRPMLQLERWCHSKSPSVCLSVHNVQIPWSHIGSNLECFKNNFMAEWLKVSAQIDPNSQQSGPNRTPQKIGWNRGEFRSTKTCSISETLQDRTKVTMKD